MNAAQKLHSSWARLETLSVVGVLRATSEAQALTAATAAIEGGLKCIEVTFSTPGAADLIQLLCDRYPNVTVGAGTVTGQEQLHQSAEAGADFVVSPHFNEELTSVALELGIPYLPGVLTPTEVQRATNHGCVMVKIFPVSRLGGPAYVQDLLGPFPQLKAMVTGGISIEEIPRYLKAGAKSVGLGSIFAETAKETRYRTEELLRLMEI